MKFDFNKESKEYEKEAGIGGEIFKVKEGQNPIRLVSRTERYVSSYKGNINTKFLCYVIDRADKKVKLYFMPYTIMKMIGDLQITPDYGFEDVPMPYDVTISATKAGTKEVSYTVIPARGNTELSLDELEDMKKQKTLAEVIKALKDKQVSEPMQDINNLNSEEWKDNGFDSTPQGEEPIINTPF